MQLLLYKYSTDVFYLVDPHRRGLGDKRRHIAYTCSLCKLFIIITVMYDMFLLLRTGYNGTEETVFIKSNLFHIDLHKMFPLHDLISALDKQK